MALFLLACLVAGLLSTSCRGYVAPSSLCPDSWAEFEGRCYQYFPDRVTWEEAKQNCLNLGSGSELASVHNAAHNTFLFYFAMSQIATTPSYWIGVNDIDVEGTFINADGSQFDYMNWRSGEPNDHNANEDCVHVEIWLEVLGWNDFLCTSTLPYMCEIATPRACSE